MRFLGGGEMLKGLGRSTYKKQWGLPRSSEQKSRIPREFDLGILDLGIQV